jgi:hypothetical protein
LRREIGDFNRDGRSDILCQESSGNRPVMERDSRRIAREWNREIEAEIRRLAARRDEGWGRVVVWTVLELVWLVAVFAVLGVFSRLY